MWGWNTPGSVEALTGTPTAEPFRPFLFPPLYRYGGPQAHMPPNDRYLSCPRPKPATFDKARDRPPKNRKAYFDYAVEDKFEAGIQLQGTEVKSLRGGEGSIAESYARHRRRRSLVDQCQYPPNFRTATATITIRGASANCCSTPASSTSSMPPFTVRG